MSRRIYLLLFALDLLVLLIVARLEPIPGYLDADYYYAGGIQLAQGKGFTEPYIWNFLDNPQSLPHPSHSYWMPLASMISALGMWITGQVSYATARIPFILIAACVPPLTAALAYTFSQRRDLAITSGLLAIFSGFHLAFMPVTDNYGVFMALGGLYFLVAVRDKPYVPFLFGIFAGLMTLARNDGLIWLALTFLLILWRTSASPQPRPKITAMSISILFALGGFLLIMGPWYFRNWTVYGALMAPGTSRTLWLTTYDETFSFPATRLNLQSWLASGWNSIFKIRLDALGSNLESAFAAHGHIILFPFILVGIRRQWADLRVRIGALAWFGLFAVMTVVFPFAGARGSFFHSDAALQPLWWSLAPIGLEASVAWARKRNLFTPKAFVLFRIVVVQVMIFLSIYLVWYRTIHLGWQEGELGYPAAEQFLVANGIKSSEPVIVLSAPGYYIMTGRPAIVQPYGDPQTVLAVARQYHVQYLVFEAAGRLPLIKDLYDHPQAYDHFKYLGEVDGSRIFRIEAEN